jgi:hypothetical protein
MRPFGIVLIIAGALLVAGALNMDTTTWASNDPIHLSFQRVNNIGLMQAQQNTLILGGLAVLVGVILFAGGGRKQPEGSHGGARKCPFCAEMVKAEAIVCKHCGKDIPSPPAAARVAQPPNAGDAQSKVCWTCCKYASGMLDRSTGTCTFHKRKTYASDTCKDYSPFG